MDGREEVVMSPASSDFSRLLLTAKSRLGLIAVCVCILVSVGCDGVASATPSDSGTRVTPPPRPPSPTVTVEFSGRVVDADAGGPVSNVRVSVVPVAWVDKSVGWVGSQGLAATSGGDGTFTFAVNLPSSWRSIYLDLTGPAGYDNTHWGFSPGSGAVRPTIRMYPTLVISPGESIDVRVDVFEACGWGGEAGVCRRVLVAASPGEPVELELVPDDTSKPMGLSPDDFGRAYMPVPRLTVPPGVFFYVIGDGTARLTARR